MELVGPAVAQMVCAIAARELGAASLLNSVSDKIDRLTLDEKNAVRGLSELRLMAVELLRALNELERSQSPILSKLLEILDLTGKDALPPAPGG
ncbi:MAG: hypothetical protein NUV93_08955 [Firmicutes bacterium]|jgi:hypothetical protein|nr:hypothetical protein [Bacillota bacterium]